MQLLGTPDAAIISFSSSKFDIFSLIDRVHDKGCVMPFPEPLLDLLVQIA